jgi:beta-N-acetylhexosaminidase
MSIFTTRQLLAQCLMVDVEPKDYATNENVRTALHTLIRDEGIGGVCVFAGEVLQTAQMLQELQQTAMRAQHPPLIVSADFEFGVAMRLEGGTPFPHAMALGTADDVVMTERVARAIALEAKALGIHWNFAPVADINSNPLNPIINIRAFGETPEQVSRHVEAYIRGTEGERVLASAKHFPGHGDTATDSHISLPTLNADAAHIRAFELEPFRAAIVSGVKSIMVGHLAIPALEADAPLPASLSHAIMTRLLREELGFEGIIITDALNMHSITNTFSVEDAAVKAFAAGTDVVLIPPDPLRALNALEAAVESGVISLEKVHASAKRVLEAKEWCGLVNIVVSNHDAAANENWQIEHLDRAHVQRVRLQTGSDAAEPEISRQEQSLLALDAASPALRWFGDASKVQPLSQFTQIAGFALVQERDVPAATSFFRYLSQMYRGDCDFAFVDEHASESEIAELMEGTKDAEAVIFAVLARPAAYQGSITLADSFNDIAKRLAAGRKTAAVLFGNPYMRETFPADTFLCTFSPSEPSLGAAAAELNRETE